LAGFFSYVYKKIKKVKRKKMMFEIMDDRVSITMNVFIMAATLLNLMSNVTQIWRTHQRKDKPALHDFSLISLFLRFATNVIWVVYAVCLYQTILLCANLLSLLTSLYLLVVKIIEKDQPLCEEIRIDLKRNR